MQKSEYLTTSQFYAWLKPFIPILRMKHIHSWCENGRLRCESLRLKGDRGWKRIPIATECIRFLNDELDFTREERKQAMQALREIAQAPWKQGKQLTLSIAVVHNAKES
jgi:hypothetical protein